LAVVVRIFVGAVAERWNVTDTSRDDLRLVASELFAGAVEAGPGDDVSFTITSDDDRVTLQTTGVDLVDPGTTPEATGWSGRVGLIRALFPDAEVGGPVSVSVPVAPNPPS
jgi:hypothetical protein